ncbi:FAD-dependent thymidylate synthase [Streptosporangium sandarakinum]
MKVTLLGYTVATREVWDRLDPLKYNDAVPTAADRIAEYAGRICYQSWHRPRITTADTDSYLKRTIAEQRHESIARHSSAAFVLEGVSRHLLGELTRHHFAAFSVESLRYCPPRTYATHPTIAEDPFLVELQEEFWDYAREYYDQAFDHLQRKGLKTKQAREAAAQFLPLMTATDLVVSANHNAWRDVLTQRLPEAANAEIRQLARLLLAELKQLAPATFQDITIEETP